MAVVLVFSRCRDRNAAIDSLPMPWLSGPPRVPAGFSSVVSQSDARGRYHSNVSSKPLAKSWISGAD
eukprot:4335579-Pyramimonas_sp.AAC.1